jgi:glycosyltransferase involved in cell wall biosynthesis
VKISIVTVCFNSEKTISKTIESVLSQDYVNVEYIVIDGNSTDGTVDIIRSFGRSIDIFLSESDSGIYDAFNKGLKLATGDVIGILNSDDYFVSEQILSDISSEFNGNSSLDILLSGVQFISGESGKVTRKYPAVGFSPWKMYLGLMPPHPGAFICRGVYEKIGQFDASFLIAGDFELFVRIFMKNDFNYKKTDIVTVSMSLGGASTSGFKSYLIITKEFSRSLTKNGFFGSRLLISCRALLKLLQFAR